MDQIMFNPAKCYKIYQSLIAKVFISVQMMIFTSGIDSYG